MTKSKYTRLLIEFAKKRKRKPHSLLTRKKISLALGGAGLLTAAGLAGAKHLSSVNKLKQLKKNQESVNQISNNIKDYTNSQPKKTYDVSGISDAIRNSVPKRKRSTGPQPKFEDLDDILDGIMVPKKPPSLPPKKKR